MTPPEPSYIDFLEKFGPYAAFSLVVIWMLIQMVIKILESKKEKLAPASAMCSAGDAVYNIDLTTKSIKEAVARIEDLADDNHEWHRPNDKGQQSWKGAENTALLNRLIVVTEKTVELSQKTQFQLDSIVTILVKQEAASDRRGAAISSLNNAVTLLIQKQSDTPRDGTPSV